MAITTLSDLQIVPDKFAQYIVEETTKKNALVQAGVAVEVPQVSEVINGTPKGGKFIDVPFYKPLTGEDEVFSENAMTPGKVETGADIAALLIRQKAWGDTDMARVLGGTDPLEAIAGMASDWWVAREQAVALSILDGLFKSGGALASAHLLDISSEEGSAAVIDAEATLDAKQLMGDAAGKLGVVIMHSAVYTKLQKDNLITTEYPSDAKVGIDYYLGYRVLVDDDMPVASGVYTTYLLGQGAFARNDGMPQGLVGIEQDRNALASASYLINRRAFVLHPQGFKFNTSATLAGSTPSNSELATAANWTRSKDLKNIPIVALKARVAASA